MFKSGVLLFIQPGKIKHLGRQPVGFGKFTVPDLRPKRFMHRRQIVAQKSGVTPPAMRKKFNGKIQRIVMPRPD